MEQNKKGGKRDNSGRRKIAPLQKKVPITVYIEYGIIQDNGGKEKVTDELYNFAKGNFVSHPITMFRDITKPTVELKPFDQPITNYEVKMPPKPETLNLGDYNAFEEDIYQTRDGNELDAVMKKIKASLMALGLKNKLDGIAKEHGKDFFND